LDTTRGGDREKLKRLELLRKLIRFKQISLPKPVCYNSYLLWLPFFRHCKRFIHNEVPTYAGKARKYSSMPS